MIHCKLYGRLGNNLFEIATALSIAKKLNTSVTIDQHTEAGHRGRVNADLSMFNYKFVQTDIRPDFVEYNETCLHFKEILHKDNMTLSGYFASWKYFQNIREDLLNTYFTPSETVKNSLSKYNVSDSSLGISIRRGDFLMLQHNHCVLSTEYYQEVIDKYFLDNVDSIYIFSDDIMWCKEFFGNDVFYVEESPGVQLFLMSKMKHLILSNSTFAWWGAYLNQNDGLIIAPDPWLGPAHDDKNTGDIYYTTWIRHSHERKIQEYTFNENFYK
jgi:hypothetical protein